MRLVLGLSFCNLPVPIFLIRDVSGRLRDNARVKGTRRLVSNKERLSVKMKNRRVMLVTLHVGAFEIHAHLSSWPVEEAWPRTDRDRKIDVQCSRARGVIQNG